MIKALLLIFIPCSLFANWMDKTVEREFALWEESGIPQEMIETTWEYCSSQSHEFKRYQVISSKVYGKSSPIKNLLQAIAEKYPLPDLDIIYYHADVIGEDFFDHPPLSENAPIFVSAKTEEFDRVVLFVDWYYNVAESKKGWNGLIKTINSRQKRYPWEQKTEKLFWRGTPTDGVYTKETWTDFPRGTLVYNSTNLYPDLVDAAFVDVKKWQTDDISWFKESIGLDRFASPSQHLAYKYQLIIDGVTSTYPGTHWRLLSGCLSFKQASNQIMWFSSELIPWKHYVPVEYDLSDLLEKILWAKEHDQQAEAIAENARQFALAHLMPEEILLYCYKTLCKYAELQERAKQ